MTQQQWHKRPAAVAGQFYPAKRQALQQSVQQYLAVEPAAVTGLVRAVIVPHAGYQYCGRIAGKAYALIQAQAQYDRVVVLAPSHRVGMAKVSVGHYDRYATPLGEMPVDVQACERLLEGNPLFSDDVESHVAEHALEVHVPFLQAVLPEAQLIPLVCGQLDRTQLDSVAQTLAQQLWQNRTLWVVSSDFTHYGHAFGYVPFHTDVRRRLHELDHAAIRYVEQVDASGFLDYVDRTEATICGAVPIAIMLAACKYAGHQSKGRLLEYTTSGDMTHDYTHSVSYAAIAIADDLPVSLPILELSHLEQQQLLQWAQAAIQAGVSGLEPPAPDPHQLSPALLRPAATFVTLHLDGNLRGCIGEMQPRQPLYRSVIKNALHAAFSDNRFRPVTAAEQAKLQLQITVLSPLQLIDSTDQIELGRHGIYLEKNGCSAVFLPQVPGEQQWDLPTTLNHLAAKAGLPPTAWRQGAQFQVFEALVFGQ